MDNSDNLTVSMGENEKITIGGIQCAAQQDREKFLKGVPQVNYLSDFFLF